MEIRAAGEADRAWIRAKLIESWGSDRMALRGELIDAAACAALVAEDNEGVLHYRILEPGVMEIVTLEAYRTGRGIGTALIEAIADVARRAGCMALTVVTTNDNLDALRFYQSRGFRLHELRAGAVDRSRETIKPEIGLVGNYGLPIRDEIELRMDL
jgi:ribosomal protein S18 acetylase RimI-like enzyme